MGNEEWRRRRIELANKPINKRVHICAHLHGLQSAFCEYFMLTCWQKAKTTKKIWKILEQK